MAWAMKLQVTRRRSDPQCTQRCRRIASAAAAAVGRTGADPDSRQHHWQLEIAQVRRLAHDVLAREIAAGRFEHLYNGDTEL